jgi:predicted signal transduction protein with EAL and GGDEF domain
VIGQRLNRCLRASDTVARLGGDEFSAVIEGIKQLTDIDAVASKLQSCLAPSFRVGETDLTVGASIGVAVYPDDGADADTLLRRADSAMYAAKRGGSSHFRLFAASMEKADGASLRLEQALNMALERGEMRLAYQPVGRVADGMMIGMEALLRWHNPILGDVMPDRFIPLLESSGRINQVGLWVVEQACAQLAAWRDAGIDLVPVAVNVSAVQLVDGDFPDQVKETLQRFAIPPRLLTLELTETAVVEDETVGVLALERLARLGVWLHMDDFGTGWSSLGLLRKLPFDTVKIDRSFVMDIAHSDADALLVAGIISMAHSLNKQVIAEGVETDAQLALLKGYQCDNAQGWLFGHPEAPGQIEELLRDRKALG